MVQAELVLIRCPRRDPPFDSPKQEMGDRVRQWEDAVGVVGVHPHGEVNLPDVIKAGNAITDALGSSERGQEHSCEDSDNADHDQKLNQSERGRGN